MKAYIQVNGLFCVILGFIITFFCIKIAYIRYTAYVSNDFSDDSTIFFTVNNSTQQDILESISELDWIQAELSPNYYAVNFKNTRYVPMISGDFFQTTQGYNYNIVIGNNYSDKIFFIDEIPFIEFNSINFHVCGIIGMETPSPLDKNIYFLLPEVFKWCSEGTLFSTNDITVLSYENIELVKIEKTNLLYFLRYDFFVAVLAVLFTAGILVSIFYASNICDKKKNENLLLSSLGYNKFQILLFNLRIYLIEFTAFYTIGLLIGVFSFYKNYYSFSCIILIIAVFIALFIVGCVCIMFFTSKNERKQHETYNI